MDDTNLTCDAPLSLPAALPACKSEVVEPSTPPALLTPPDHQKLSATASTGTLKRVVSVEILSRKFSYTSPVVVQQNGTLEKKS